MPPATSLLFSRRLCEAMEPFSASHLDVANETTPTQLVGLFTLGVRAPARLKSTTELIRKLPRKPTEQEIGAFVIAGAPWRS
jgi:hypothetical protein